MNYKNTLVTFTHASYYVPFYLRPFLSSNMKRDNNRLLKNFSDFATFYLSEGIDERNKVICNFSRSIWDPNRGLDSHDLFRENDFNNIKVWKITFPNFIKKYLINKYYKKYHNEVEKKLLALEQEYWNVIHLDIHDTGNILMWETIQEDKNKDLYFPVVNLWNIDNTSCTNEFSNKICGLFEKEFWEKPKLNWPYWGGFVTKKYGVWFSNRETIQVEFGRYLFMDERTQIIDQDKMKKAIDNFENVLLELSRLHIQN